MTSVKERLKPHPQPRLDWFGIVASNPTKLSDRISVVVPDFDSNFRWEGCRWMSRDAVSLPKRGDECLIRMDSRGQPWVLAWWPF